MVSHALKTAVVIFLASAVLPAAAVHSQAEDLAAGTVTLTSSTVDVPEGRTFPMAATEAVGFPLSSKKSGSSKPPMPETGISALLIAGIAMIGLAVRRPTVAA
jgi:hypothetical protein